MVGEAVLVAASAAGTDSLFAGTSLVHRQGTTIDVLRIQRLNCRTRLIRIIHFYEAKAVASTRLTVLDDLCAAHLAVRGKQIFQILTRGAVTQITDIWL